MRGVINMRGSIVTVIDLALRFDAARSAPSDGSVLVVCYRDRAVGLVVDDVLDVRPVAIDEALAPSLPATGDAPVVRGIAQFDDMPVFVLDLDVLIKHVLVS